MNIKTVLFCAIIWLTLNFLLVYGRSLVSRKGSERLKMYGKAAKSLVAAVIMGCVGIWATSQPWFGINLPNTASFGQIMLGLICLLGVLCYGVTMFCAIFGQIMMIVSWAGAMDLVAGVKKVIVLMEHTAGGKPKLLKSCTLPLTGQAVVDMVVSELGVFAITPQGVVLVEVAPGVTIDEIREKTEAEVHLSPNLKMAA